VRDEPYSKVSVSFAVLAFALAGLFLLITVVAVYISTLVVLPQTPIILGPPVG
jgi:hypothetical protein